MQTVRIGVWLMCISVCIFFVPIAVVAIVRHIAAPAVSKNHYDRKKVGTKSVTK